MSFGEGAGPEDRRWARKGPPQWLDPQLCSLSLPEPVEKHMVPWGQTLGGGFRGVHEKIHIAPGAGVFILLLFRTVCLPLGVLGGQTAKEQKQVLWRCYFCHLVRCC